MTNSGPSLWELIKAILIPFNTEPFEEAYLQLISEAKTTSWTSLFRRVANIGLFFTFFGLVLLLIIFGYMNGIDDIGVPKYGISYLIGGAILLILLISKFILGIAEGVNTASSVFAEEGEESNLYFVALEFIFGSILVVGFIFIIMESTSGIFQIAKVLAVLLFLFGMILAGGGMIGSSLSNIFDIYRTKDEENRTLSEFETEQ